MKPKVKLERLDPCLENMPAYIEAMNRVRETARAHGVSEQALNEILKAYQEVEQIRADFLCRVGFPVKERCLIYGPAENQKAG